MTLKKLLLYLSALVIGLILVSFLMFWLAVHPPKIRSDETPKKYGLTYEDVTIESFDKTELKGWYLPAKKPTDKALLLLHSYPLDKGDLLPSATLFEINFNVLLLDLRGMGQSGGYAATFGSKEQKDITYALDFLQKKGNSKIGIFGYAEGGTIGLLAAARDSRIQALATYAAFSDFSKLEQNRYKKLTILDMPLTWLSVFWQRLFFGPLPDPARAAASLHIPVLLIHNQNDEVVPFAQGQELKTALAKNLATQVYFSVNGSHNEPPLDFELKVNNFFKDNLR